MCESKEGVWEGLLKEVPQCPGRAPFRQELLSHKEVWGPDPDSSAPLGTDRELPRRHKLLPLC